MVSEAVLDLQRVAVVRSGSRILDHIDWTVRQGEQWVVLGPNGAGKSTLLELASTYEVPSRGTIDVLGNRVGRTDLRELRRRVGYAGTPLARRVRPELTTAETVLTGPRAMLSVFRQHFDEDERARAKTLLAELGLDGVAERPMGALSDGERQRAQLARTLMTDSELLLLDEPTAGLDVAGRELLLGRLARLALDRRPRAAVLVTHHLEEIPPTATHALLLRDGSVHAQGPIESTLTGTALSACFDLSLDVGRRGGRWWAQAG